MALGIPQNIHILQKKNDVRPDDIGSRNPHHSERFIQKQKQNLLHRIARPTWPCGVIHTR